MRRFFCSMPYETIADLPANIRKLPEKKQKQWLAAFNSSYSKCQEDGGKDCESIGFRNANGVIKKEKKSVDLSMSFEEISNQLRLALKEQFTPTNKDLYPWIAQTYFSHVIAQMNGGKYYSISYVVLDGEVTFSEQSDWTEVESKQIWLEKKAIEMKAGARHSSGDMSMLQQMHDGSKLMHDVAVGLGANCNCEGQQPTDDKKPDKETTEDEASKKGNALKAISESETEYRAANYIILFSPNGERDLEGLGSTHKNADGSIGEYFTKSTDFESTYTATGLLYVDWEHGREDLNKDEILGYVDWSTKAIDERGVWVERVLNRRNKYVQWLKTLIDAGLVGTSSEPVQPRIQKALDGHITRWPLKRDTLTVTPMEPRMMSDNTLAALKALAGEIPCVKNACLKSGLTWDCTELDIQANLAYINSVLEV